MDTRWAGGSAGRPVEVLWRYLSTQAGFVDIEAFRMQD